MIIRPQSLPLAFQPRTCTGGFLWHAAQSNIHLAAFRSLPFVTPTRPSLRQIIPVEPRVGRSPARCAASTGRPASKPQSSPPPPPLVCISTHPPCAPLRKASPVSRPLEFPFWPCGIEHLCYNIPGTGASTVPVFFFHGLLMSELLTFPQMNSALSAPSAFLRCSLPPNLHHPRLCTAPSHPIHTTRTSTLFPASHRTTRAISPVRTHIRVVSIFNTKTNHPSISPPQPQHKSKTIHCRLTSYSFLCSSSKKSIEPHSINLPSPLARFIPSRQFFTHLINLSSRLIPQPCIITSTAQPLPVQRISHAPQHRDQSPDPQP